MQEKKLKSINTRDMTVTFENPLDGSDFFAKKVDFKDTAEITEVIRAAEDILDKYDLDFVCFEFRGGWYLTEKEKEKEE